MPRIYISQNDPLDFCQLCYPSETLAEELYANLGNNPDDPERGNCYGYDCEHPDYESEGYHCIKCHEPLIESDN